LFPIINGIEARQLLSSLGFWQVVEIRFRGIQNKAKTGEKAEVMYNK